MTVETREQNGATIVVLSGDVDLSRSPSLRKALMDLMFDKVPVVVEMAAVTYIDSSGVAALVEAYQMARRNGTRFALAAASDPVRRVLHLARLDRVFAMADTVEAALA